MPLALNCSRSRVMPALSTRLNSQNQYTRGLAESGGAAKPGSRFPSAEIPAVAKKSAEANSANERNPRNHRRRKFTEQKFMSEMDNMFDHVSDKTERCNATMSDSLENYNRFAMTCRREFKRRILCEVKRRQI